MGKGLRYNCDSCNCLLRPAKRNIIPEGHFLKDSTNWDVLCIVCALYFKVPLGERCQRRLDRIKERGLKLPDYEELKMSPNGVEKDEVVSQS